MKKRTSLQLIFIFCFLFGVIFSSVAQEEINPVAWSIEIVNTKSDSSKLIAKANIEYGWHIYSQVISQDPEAIGPMPLEFIFSASEEYNLIGKPVEISEMITHFDKAFDIDLNYYKDELEVHQLIEIVNKTGFVKGSISYMACDDEKCIFPPEFIFEIKITE